MNKNSKTHIVTSPPAEAPKAWRVQGVSLYPEHVETLALRVKQFRICRSEIVRILLEAERRKNIIRTEISRRLVLSPKRKGAA